MKENNTYAYNEKIRTEWALGNWGQAQALIAPSRSLDEPIPGTEGESEGLTRGDILPDPVSVEEDVVGRLNYEDMIQDLPDNLQVVIRLRYEMGYTTDQIGELIGIKGGTVRVRMGKALKMLRGNQLKSLE